MGFTEVSGHPSLGGLLPHRFPLPFDAQGIEGGFLSVALSLALRLVDVIDHLACWSPDFPPRFAIAKLLLRLIRRSDCPTSRPGYCIPREALESRS